MTTSKHICFLVCKIALPNHCSCAFVTRLQDFRSGCQLPFKRVSFKRKLGLSCTNFVPSPHRQTSPTMIIVHGSKTNVPLIHLLVNCTMIVCWGVFVCFVTPSDSGSCSAKVYAFSAIHGSLSRSGVESKLLLETAEPIIRVILSIQGRYRIFGHLNCQAITTVQGLSVLPVEGHARFGAGIIGNDALQHDVVRKHHGSEGQYVRTNGCYHDSRYCRMNHGPSRGHRIRRAPRGCGKNNPIRLHRRQVVMIAKTFQRRQVW